MSNRYLIVTISKIELIILSSTFALSYNISSLILRQCHTYRCPGQNLWSHCSFGVIPSFPSHPISKTPAGPIGTALSIELDFDLFWRHPRLPSCFHSASFLVWISVFSFASLLSVLSPAVRIILVKHMLISHISVIPLFKILQWFLVAFRVKPMFLMADMALHDMSPTISLTSSPYCLPLVPSQAYSKLGPCNVGSLSLKVCHMANPLISFSFVFLLKLSPQWGLAIHSILNLSWPQYHPQTPDSFCPAIILFSIHLSSSNIPCN